MKATVASLVAAVGALAACLLSNPTRAPAQAIINCRPTTTCETSLEQCREYRTRTQISKAELPCERSAAECRSTGIWRGKYMRGTPEVNACKMLNR